MAKPAPASSEAPPMRGAMVAYTIALLFLVNVFNFLDRQLPAILAQSIKADLELSDTQLGLLGGLAFAVVYATLALPLARLADRWSPKWVLTGSLGLWSLLTAAGGFAQNFAQLAASRMGVAAGEAGSTPAAHSLISSLVSTKRRGLALGVFSLGVPMGGMAGLMLGGWLNDLHSWRFAMIAMGLPGLVVALLFALSVPDRRGAAAKNEPGASLSEAARFLCKLPSYRHLMYALTVFGIGVYASYNFIPAFLIRTYGISTGQAGLVLGALNGIAGGIGAFGGGWLGDILGRQNPSRTLMLPAVGFLIAAPIFLAALFAPTLAWAVGLLAFPQLAKVMYVAPVFGVAQALAPPRMRAMASAILLFALSLLGASLGPYLAGVLSDLLRPRFGDLSLRYALGITSLSLVWAAGHLWWASRMLKADLTRTAAEATAGDQSAAK